MPIFTVMTWDMLTHSRFTPECFLIRTAKGKTEAFGKRMRAKESKLLTRIHFYRRNTTGKAGCICSERRENVACFVFELRM